MAVLQLPMGDEHHGGAARPPLHQRVQSLLHRRFRLGILNGRGGRGGQQEYGMGGTEQTRQRNGGDDRDVKRFVSKGSHPCLYCLTNALD